jgi:hypothetical protein
MGAAAAAPTGVAPRRSSRARAPPPAAYDPGGRPGGGFGAAREWQPAAPTESGGASTGGAATTGAADPDAGSPGATSPGPSSTMDLCPCSGPSGPVLCNDSGGSSRTFTHIHSPPRTTVYTLSHTYDGFV